MFLTEEIMKQETALTLLKAGENVFLTGSAGAGKTYTLNQYIHYLKARKVPVAITASTGIAATHMNGMTIHTWAGIGIKDRLSDDDLKRMKERKYLKEHLENAQVLIIDEISMLHAKQLNLVNQVLKYFKESDEAFGGIQVIVAGDFFQLPPVGRKDESNRDKFCFMSEAWVEAKFRVCYLTEQHRQDDEILNQIKIACDAAEVDVPHIFTEFGSFTVGEAGGALYQVLYQKKQNDRENWNMIDSSFITTLPDTWAINKRFVMLAVNRWNDNYERVLLGGLTCDGDDYYNSEQHMNAVYLPKYNKEKPLYIGFFNTGAYQETIGGYGGLSHCILPQPKHILIDKDKNGIFATEVFSEQQNAEQVLEILGYNKNKNENK